jgi:hypothetical protein
MQTASSTSNTVALLADKFRMGSQVMPRDDLLARMADGWLAPIPRCDRDTLRVDRSHWGIQDQIWKDKS